MIRKQKEIDILILKNKLKQNKAINSHSQQIKHMGGDNLLII